MPSRGTETYAVVKKFGDGRPTCWWSAWYGFTAIYPLLLAAATVLGQTRLRFEKKEYVAGLLGYDGHEPPALSAGRV